MPPIENKQSEDSADENAFTVLNYERSDSVSETFTDVEDIKLKHTGKNVNVVKPLQKDDSNERNHLNSATKEELIERMAGPFGPQTILDPKFSRALDFKLRRLKDKEIRQINLSRPTKHQVKTNLSVAASNPNINSDQLEVSKRMSRSQQRLDNLAPNPDSNPSSKISSKTFDKSPISPDRKSKPRKISGSNDLIDKPRFVTTVKTGQFLPPPPELASLLGLDTLYPQEEKPKIVYSYSSKPQALASRKKRSTNIETKQIPPEEKEKKFVNNLFSGVRSLVAGVIGMKTLAKQEVQTNGPVSNLMFDKRVVRGSVFGAHPAAGDADLVAVKRSRRRAAARKQAAARLRPGTPPPAPGRNHHPIQTECYLEELFDKGIEYTIGTQTDLFIDRPATPIYVPAKTGKDAATQIYPGELFDFDLEVQPILEVLVGKTVEQALAEVAQEEELATLREQQRRFMELRDAERAERQRLAAMDERLRVEKDRRVAEARAAKQSALEVKERIAAATLIQGYVAELLPTVLTGLKEQGFLLERIEKGVSEEFIPWLVKEVSDELEAIISSRDVITEIVRDVVETRAELYRTIGEKEANREEPIESDSSLAGEGEMEEEEAIEDVTL